MQLIGPHQILRLLRDIALNGGQQLRGHGRVQNVLQHAGELAVLVLIVPGEVCHQMPHQRLGDGAVDGVVAHVVAVVGAPAQRQLREVAGADDDAAGLVGHVHQDLRPLPGLSVLKGHGVVCYVVADVLEVAADGGGDVHGLERGPQPLGQDHRVVLRPVGGAEAGHGHRHDVRHGPVQHLQRQPGNEDGQCGVQSAGKTHHRSLGVGVLQPLLQTQRRDQQDLAAALVPVVLSLRHKGLGRDIARELRARDSKGERRDGHVFTIGEELRPAPLVSQLLHVDLGEEQVVLEPALRQHGAVLRNHLVGAEHHVGGGLSLAGAGVQIAAQQLGGLHRRELAAVGVLADQVVAGGEVADDRRSGGGQRRRRRHRRPQILADLKAQRQLRNLLAAEELLCAEGHRLAAQTVDGEGGFLRRGGELPFFVKLAVIGQVRLGDHAQNVSLLDHRGAVIELAADPQGHSHRSNHLQIPGGLQHGGKGLLRTPQQRVLIEKIAAGIARQSQFRQNEDLCAGLLRPAHHGERLLRVAGAVRQMDRGTAAGHRDQTVFHAKRLQ